MDIFSRHELINTQEGYTLVLYFDIQSSEFAKEFISSLTDKTQELSKNAADSIKIYIDKNLKNVKISTVKVVLGSLLIASIPIGAIYDSKLGAAKTLPSNDTADTNTPINEQEKTVEDKSSTVTNTHSKDQNTKSQAPRSSSTSRTTTVIPKDNLVLVNKTHSLSSSYVPDDLVYPNVTTTNKSKTMMSSEAAKALEALFEKAKQDNIQLYAVSGYRSYSLQKQIFESNTIKSGSEESANQYSARPGQSEHQTGLVMDVSSKSVNFTLVQAFAQTAEGKWLKENAPQFGFIIRYTQGKENITGYQFEPWHIRYVGKAAALEISSKNITLEEYLQK